MVARGVAAAAEIDDPLNLPGTGLIAFGALPSTLGFVPPTSFVPRMVLGRRGGRVVDHPGDVR